MCLLAGKIKKCYFFYAQRLKATSWLIFKNVYLVLLPKSPGGWEIDFYEHNRCLYS